MSDRQLCLSEKLSVVTQATADRSWMPRLSSKAECFRCLAGREFARVRPEGETRSEHSHMVRTGPLVSGALLVIEMFERL